MAMAVLDSVEAVRGFSERLQVSARFRGTSRPGDDEPLAWSVAWGLAEVERSCRRLLDELLPALVSSSDEDQIMRAVGEVSEELKHLLYHVATTPRVFDLVTDWFELRLPELRRERPE